MKAMDDLSLVYGVIVDDASQDLAYLNRARLKNAEVLKSLAQARYPWLRADMFHSQGGYGFNGQHEPQLIHFALSMNGLEFGWQAFIRHFEKLLADLYWTSVRLQLETELAGKHQFYWYPEVGRHAPGQPLRLHCEWQREHSLSGVG